MNQDTMISEAVSQYLPERFRFRCGDTTFCIGAAAALALAILVLANLGSSSIWLFGASISVPLSVQWLLAFVAGGVASLRVKRVQQLRYARAAEHLAASSARNGHPIARPTVLAPPLRSAANTSRFNDPGSARPVHSATNASTGYSQRVG